MNIFSPIAYEIDYYNCASLEEYQLKTLYLALDKAWDCLCKEKYDVLKDEDLTTLALQEKLAIIQRDGDVIPGFSYKHYETIDSGIKSKAVKKGKETREYDLVIRPCGQPPVGLNKPKYGLFIEAKRLIKGGPSLNDYVKDGVLRFIEDGDYAERMAHALMLGYTDTTFSLPVTFATYITESKAQCAQKCKNHTKGVMPFTQNSCVYITIFDRTFIYPNGQPAPQIALHHLWLH